MHRRFVFALVLGLALALGTAAQAFERTVIVNGERVDAATLSVLDALAGGFVPDGAYWLDTSTGIWGYAGDPTPRGVLGQAQANTGHGSPGDQYTGTNYRGPFGDYMSDGQCSFVNGIPVGNC